MKKKLLTLFMALVLICTNNTVAFAAESLTEPTEMANAIPTATGAEALAAIGKEDSVVLDIRAAADYNQAHIKGALSNPVCKADFSVTTDEKDAFIKFAQENIGTEKKVYLICYVGTFCVNFASKWLTESGYDAENLYRVTGGVWNDADLSAACNSTHYDYVLDDVANGNGVILDVRATDVYYANGYVDKSLHQPLFTVVDGANKVTSGSDELATNFSAFIAANKDYLSGKDIYILCNSGKSGAVNATLLLAKAGYKTVASPEGCNVFTIEGGATSDIKNSFVNNASVAGNKAIADFESNSAVILDVRATSVYDQGHVKNSLHSPLFTVVDGTNKVSSCYDELATNFLKYVESNAAKLEGKPIYILCNSGKSGAKAATKLLMQAGYSSKDVIRTITDGATDEAVKATFVKSLPAISEYNFVSGTNAAGFNKDVDLSNVFVIDVRTPENFAKGTLDGAVNWPLFNSAGVTSGEDALADEFTANVKANEAALAGKDIYILCNSGARGAQNATKLLVAAGYDQKNIFTITNGAKGLDVRYAMLGENPITPVTSEDALKAVGSTDIVIIDVRAAGNFAKGHLKGAVSLPLFTSEGVVPTADADLAKAFVEKAKSGAFDGKEIYVLCNSGQSGARAATVLLNKEADIALDKIHTITGGYNKNADIQAAAIYVTPERAINAAETPEADKLIIDVRGAELYANGHLKGSVSLPLFDAEKNLPDDLAEAFVAAVKANKEAFEGKTVYILCNSGSRGAVKATELLASLGITNVFTIEGGAASETIKPYLTSTDATTLEDIIASDNEANNGEGTATPDAEPETDSSSTGTVKTGDTNNIMPYVMVMAIALLAIVVVSKKKFTK